MVGVYSDMPLSYQHTQFFATKMGYTKSMKKQNKQVAPKKGSLKNKTKQITETTLLLLLLLALVAIWGTRAILEIAATKYAKESVVSTVQSVKKVTHTEKDTPSHKKIRSAAIPSTTPRKIFTTIDGISFTESEFREYCKKLRIDQVSPYPLHCTLRGRSTSGN